jgi:phosphohistidine swiveling domain-containing protein
MTIKNIASGIAVCPGTITGKACVIKNNGDINNIEPGSIIIIPRSHPMYAIALMNASAVICETGARVSHICLVSIEMGIPCITQVKDIMKKVVSGQTITVDATKGEVYAEE